MTTPFQGAQPTRRPGARAIRHGLRVAAAAVCVACVAFAIVAVVAGIGSARGAGTVKVYFGQGEQLVAVDRSGSTVADALQGLIAGPTSAETAAGMRTYVPPGTVVRSATVSGSVATVDVGETFMVGTATDTELARLDQLVSTVTAVPGVTSVQLLIKGGTPLGLFPGVDATVPLTRAALATPNTPATTPTTTPTGPVTSGTRGLQQQLASLGYLLPANVDGVNGPATQTAIIGFQKWQRLDRTGVADARTRSLLAHATRPTPVTTGPAGRRVEVLIDRQLVLAIQDNQVVRAIAVSTGKPSTPTPTGSFKVYGKFPKWWSTPFREWLLWASPFDGGVAMHQYPDVPVYAASHGCVRVTQYDAHWLFDFVSVDTPVRVIASSS
jgi:lipoprotein-anchoring transpeptidase ErfK/SrfK